MINNEIKFFLSIAITVINLSCSEDIVSVQSFDRSLDGKYRLVSMNFKEPIDIDLDGIKSKDVLSEIHLMNKKDDFSADYETRLRSEMMTGSDYQMFTQKLPLTVVIADPNTGQFLEKDYRLTNALYKCFYRIGDKNITVWHHIWYCSWLFCFSNRERQAKNYSPSTFLHE